MNRLRIHWLIALCSSLRLIFCVVIVDDIGIGFGRATVSNLVRNGNPKKRAYPTAYCTGSGCNKLLASTQNSSTKPKGIPIVYNPVQYPQQNTPNQLPAIMKALSSNLPKGHGTPVKDNMKSRKPRNNDRKRASSTRKPPRTSPSQDVELTESTEETNEEDDGYNKGSTTDRSSGSPEALTKSSKATTPTKTSMTPSKKPKIVTVTITSTTTTTTTKAEPENRTTTTPEPATIKAELDLSDTLADFIDFPPKWTPEKRPSEDYDIKHKYSIDDADHARKHFIDQKLASSRTKQLDIDRKLEKLRGIASELQGKWSVLEKERDNIKSKLKNAKARLRNSEASLKKMNKDIRDNETQTRLNEIETLRLEKLLEEENTKLSMLKDQHTVLKEYLKRIVNEESRVSGSLQGDEGKLRMYEKVLRDLKANIESLAEQIAEVEELRAHEVELQNRLSIEKEQDEDDKHISLFTSYT